MAAARLALAPVLLVALAAPAATAPLPPAGLVGTLHPVHDPEDAVPVRLEPGTTHRIAIHSTGPGCARLRVLAPGARSTSAPPVAVLPCDGYATLTPRPGRGGTYTLVPFVTPTTPSARYRLFVAPAGPDDLPPGRPLPRGRPVDAVVAGRGVDRVDVYGFTLRRRGRVGLRVTVAGPVSLRLQTGSGRLVECVCDDLDDIRLDRVLPPGRYAVVLRALPGHGGRYRLLRVGGD